MSEYKEKKKVFKKEILKAKEEPWKQVRKDLDDNLGTGLQNRDEETQDYN